MPLDTTTLALVAVGAVVLWPAIKKATEPKPTPPGAVATQTTQSSYVDYKPGEGVAVHYVFG